MPPKKEHQNEESAINNLLATMISTPSRPVDSQEIAHLPADSRATMITELNKALRTLSYREREIIKLRRGIGDGYTYTLEEVGHIFKVTRERIRGIERKAFDKLKELCHSGPIFQEFKRATSKIDDAAQDS